MDGNGMEHPQGALIAMICNFAELLSESVIAGVHSDFC